MICYMDKTQPCWWVCRWLLSFPAPNWNCLCCGRSRLSLGFMVGPLVMSKRLQGGEIGWDGQPSPWSPSLRSCQIPRSPVDKISGSYFPKAPASSSYPAPVSVIRGVRGRGEGRGGASGGGGWRLKAPSEGLGQGGAPIQRQPGSLTLGLTLQSFCPRPRFQAPGTLRHYNPKGNSKSG